MRAAPLPFVILAQAGISVGKERRLTHEIPAFAGMTRKVLAILLTLLLALTVLAGTARAETFPAFTSLVVDAANVLPSDRKAALEQKLEAFQKDAAARAQGRQLVVATVPDLGGDDIADYGYKLGRAWGVGLKGANSGAILLVAPNQHKVRIEVGYGLEGVLTDAYSNVIINGTILPAFKAGDLPGGIDRGTDALINILAAPDDQAKAKEQAAIAAYDKAHPKQSDSGVPLGFIFWLVVFGVIVLMQLFRRGHRARYGDSNLPVWLWAASEMLGDHDRGSGGGGFTGGSDGGGGGWGGGGFTGGGGGSFGGGGSSGSW